MDRLKMNMIQKVYVFILAISPLIDSFNGYLIKSGITKGISLGDVYRGIMIIFILVIWSKCISKVNLGIMLILLGYLTSISLVQILFQISNNSLLNEFSNVAQWSIAFILVFSYIDFYRVGIMKINVIDKVFDIWCVITPLTLIVPYILGIGFSTYYDIGYKGFYYATNAITYFLIILFLMNMFKLTEKITLFRLFQTGVTAFCIAMLGTKSGYILLAVILIISILIQYKKNFKKGVTSLLLVTITFFTTGYLFLEVYAEQIEKIIGRHSYFSKTSDSFISFITTGRSDRISEYYMYIKHSKSFIFRLLFGSGYNIEKILGSIEMDYFDAFFMFGLIGLLIIVWFTLYVFNKGLKKSNWVFIIAYIITIAFSILGGHIWNNALSSTCFAMISCKLILGKDTGS